jgi:CHAD domain-containing protein
VRELELELRGGEAAALFRLALELHATVPMMIESQSKAARGYRLLTGEVPAARKDEDVALRAAATGADAFRQILTTKLGHLLVNQPAALAGDAEGVHQMRVAIRQLRAVLTLFQPLLEPHIASRFEAELRRIGRVFGEARDWDVFTLQILPQMLQEGGAAGWGKLLRQPAMARRAAAHRRLVQEVQAPGFTTLVLGLAVWAEEENLLGEPDLDRPIEALCPALLDRLSRKVERRGRHIGRSSDAQRHSLRKSLKKLRYGIDDLQAVLPAKAAKSYLRKCKKLQRTLGDTNDAVTAIGLANHLDEDARFDLAPAVGMLAKRLERRRSEGLQELAKRWKAFRSEPRFWA